MEHLKVGYFQGTTIENLTRTQLEAAILYIDSHIEEESDSYQVIQYCVLKVDLINKLMSLDKTDHQNFLR